MYDVKETFQAASAQEVLELLEAHPGAVLVAGGTDVMIRLKKRKLKDAVLVCLQRVPELQEVSLEPDGALCIGAGCTFAELERHELLLEHVPMLASACHQVGSPQIREMATIGGNLCNGAVSADSAPALYALDAELEVLSQTGGVRIPHGAGQDGAGSRRSAAADPHPQGVLRGPWRLLSEIRPAQRHGDLHAGVRGECGPDGGPDPDPAGGGGLRRGGPGAGALL